MKKLIPNLMTVATIAALGFPVVAGAAVSPHETISETIDGNKITISHISRISRLINRKILRNLRGFRTVK